jgi:ATP-dependent DNA ligase
MSQRSLPAGFIAPCLPIKTAQLPPGRRWLHEIKHDGFRIIARKKGSQVRLYSRPGNDLTHRFPLIVETLLRLRARSCIIDGEAVACDEKGIASFNIVRYRRNDESIFLYAFDIIELNGDDLRRDPLEGRKAKLEMMLAKAASNQRHIRRSQPTRKAALKDACDQLLQGHAVNRIVGPNETISAERVRDWCAKYRSSLKTQSPN